MNFFSNNSSPNKISESDSSQNLPKKEKRKRNKRIIKEKSKSNISSKSNNNINSILSEIKQISIPEILQEKENLYKILQSEIINIDKGIALLTKKKKYYDEIIDKLRSDIHNEKNNQKKIEIKNNEYIFMENLLKDIDINDTFENDIKGDNSCYNNFKAINENVDYNCFLLNQKKNQNFLIINFFDDKNISKIYNKMEPNYSMSYEEFNNIDDLENNFCILMNNEINKEIKDDRIIENKNKQNNSDNRNKDNQIIIDSGNEEQKNNDIKIIDNTPLKIDFSDEKKEEFTPINEAPAEEEETNNKKRKKNKKDKELDKKISKDYLNSSEETDFYLLKDSNIKKNVNIEDINKKYKTQDMGSDFLSSDDISNNDISKKEGKKVKKRKKKNKTKKNKSENDDTGNIDKSEEDLININKDKNELSELSNNINEDKSIDDNENNNEDKKSKKKKRKKKKKELDINLPLLKEEYPDPENLDNTALSLEMKKYGMKPQNKKKNIEILKSVYNFLKIKELPENILKKLTSFDIENNDENNIDSENDNIKGNKKNEITELNDETKKKIIDIIKDNKTIYEKILLFKEISIKEIKTLLNSNGIIVPNHLLSQLLLDSGAVLPGGWNNKK